MNTTTTTYEQAVTILTGEGYRREDVLAVVDSLINAQTDSERGGVTAEEMGVLRAQLAEPTDL